MRLFFSQKLSCFVKIQHIKIRRTKEMSKKDKSTKEENI